METARSATSILSSGVVDGTIGMQFTDLFLCVSVSEALIHGTAINPLGIVKVTPSPS